MGLGRFLQADRPMNDAELTAATAEWDRRCFAVLAVVVMVAALLWPSCRSERGVVNHQPQPQEKGGR